MTCVSNRLSESLKDRYLIEHEVGAGGMAVVYRARDVKHDRAVAIKVLRPELAVTLASERFLREVGIAARLQHPNILPLLDSGSADGNLYYVMPFVDGESLRQRLNRDGQLNVTDTVRILRSVVDALAYAHRNGVIHRDIKPDNVMMSGRHPLVTDFGIARALSAAATKDHTLTSAGMALGTPAYMSPEQAAADPSVDHRADIYSIGVMGYEMLAGRCPFEGRSFQQILVAHATSTPQPLVEARPGLRADVADIIGKSMAPDPDDRYATADELLEALERIEFSTTPTPTSHPVQPRSVLVPALGALVLATLVGVWMIRRPDEPTMITVGATTQFTTDNGLELEPEISPGKGELIAYAAGNSTRMRIYVRPSAGGRAIALSDDSTSVEFQPRWSPDGTKIVYLSRGSAHVAPKFGGTSQVIVAGGDRDSVLSASWAPDGRELLFVRRDSAFARDTATRADRFIATAPDLHSCVWSVGKRIACVSGNPLYVIAGTNLGNLAPSAIVVVPEAGGVFTRLTSGRALHQSPAWSPDGSILYFVSNRMGASDVFFLPASTTDTTSTPVRITTGLGAHTISVSRDSASGSKLTYATYTERSNVWSLRLRPGGVADSSTLEPVTTGNQVVESMRLSRDNKWLLFDSNLRGHAEIYRIRLPNGEPERITDDKGENFRADLSPDEKQIAFQSFSNSTRDIFVQGIDGHNRVAVTTSPRQEAGAAWSPDGTKLSFIELTGQNGAYVVERKPDGTWGEPKRIGSGGPACAEWSSDGKSLLLTYRGTVHLVHADGTNDRVVYAPRAGTDDPIALESHWRSDGSSFFFKSHDAAGRAYFWTMSTSGGTPRLVARLTSPSRTSNRPDFSATDDRLFFAIQDRQSDVWIADLTMH